MYLKTVPKNIPIVSSTFFWTPDLRKTADILKKESQLCFCAQMLIWSMGTVSGFLFACFFPTLFLFFFAITKVVTFSNSWIFEVP